jgi:hypothetical protein
MNPIIFLDKLAAAGIREPCNAMSEEDGGTVHGVGQHGDVVAQVRAPRHTERSRTHVHLRGSELAQGVEAVLARFPNAAFLGYWHLHFDLPVLSERDLQELERLHGCMPVPPCGIVKILAVKRTAAPIELKAFVSPRKGLVVPAELIEVDDVVDVRARFGANVQAPRLRPHALGDTEAAKRFAAELQELEDAGYAASADVVPQGVRLVLENPELQGELLLTIPAEGWVGRPKIEHRVAGTPRLITRATHGLLCAWSSAFTLLDAVTQARTSGAWPRRSKAAANEAGHEQ